VEETVIFCNKTYHRNYATISQKKIKNREFKSEEIYSVRFRWTPRNGNWQNKSDDIQECLMSDTLKKRITAGRLKR